MPGVVNVFRWRIPKNNHDDMMRLIAGGVDRTTGNDRQRRDHQTTLYNRTRTFFRADDADPNVEEWFFMDEFDDAETYRRQMEIWKSLPTYKTATERNHPRWKGLSLPGEWDARNLKLYTEIEALTLELEPHARRMAALERDQDPWWRLDP
jgi:hypothetical protein